LSTAQLAGFTTEYRIAEIAAIAIVTPLVLAAIARTAKRPAARDGDWTVMRPSTGLYLLAAFGGLFVLLGLALSASTILTSMQVHNRLILLTLMSLMGSAFLAFIGIYVIVTTLFIHIRFSDQGIERRFFGRFTYFPWSDVAEFRRHPNMGPQLVSRDGRHINISQYRTGHAELERLLRSRGIPVNTQAPDAD
jgi:hypothetical protein